MWETTIIINGCRGWRPHQSRVSKCQKYKHQLFPITSNFIAKREIIGIQNDVLIHTHQYLGYRRSLWNCDDLVGSGCRILGYRLFRCNDQAPVHFGDPPVPGSFAKWRQHRCVLKHTTFWESWTERWLWLGDMILHTQKEMHRKIFFLKDVQFGDIWIICKCFKLVHIARCVKDAYMHTVN